MKNLKQLSIKTLTTFLFIFLIQTITLAQCNITAYGNGDSVTVEICLGDSVVLSAIGDCDQDLMNNDFNNGTVGIGWQSTNQAMFNNPCAPHSPDGTTYLWMGSTAVAPRILTTIPYNVSNGGTISFEMRYAVQSAASPCEGPDQFDEGIAVQYSTNNGTTWNTIEYYAPNGTILNYVPTATTPGASGQTPFTVWTTRTFPIPVAAQTTATQFRWAQLASTSAIYDHWGLDNVSISVPQTTTIWWNHGPTVLNPPNVTPTTNTTYTVNISNGGSTATSQINVIVHQPPTMSINNLAATYCVNAPTANISGTPSGGTFSGNGISGNSFDPATAGVGVHTITYAYNTVSTSGTVLCTFNTTATTEVLALPVGSFTMPDTVCVGENAQIILSGIASTTTTYNWDFDGGTVVSGSGAGPYIVNWQTDGTKNVSLTITENGCTSLPYTQPIVVLPFNHPNCNCWTPPVSIFVSDVCVNEILQLTTDGLPTYNYQWNFAGGTVLSGSDNGPFAIQWNSPGVYNITLTAVNGNCFPFDTSQTVTVLPNPIISLSATSEFCGQANGTATATGGTTYNWSNGGTSPTISNLSAGNYTVTVSDGMCLSVDNITVPFINGPTANFIVSPHTQSILEPTFNFFDMSVGAMSWNWNFGDNNTSNQQNPSHEYAASGNYTITLIINDINNCYDTCYSTVNVFDMSTIYVPSAFTPDGDGINDSFIPQGIGIDNDFFEMYIYDRWGKSVFYSDDINKHWDGSISNNTHKGKIPGVYTYKILYKEVNGKEKSVVGTVTLIIP